VGVLTVHEDVVELRGRHDGEAIGDDRVVGVVAVLVDQDFGVGRGHLDEAFLLSKFLCLEVGLSRGGKTSWSSVLTKSEVCC
jgi:hypothetical protein